MGLLANNIFATNLNFLGGVQGALVTGFQRNKSFANNALVYKGSTLISWPDGSYDDAFIKAFDFGGIAADLDGVGTVIANVNATGNLTGNASGLGTIPYINLAEGRNLFVTASGVGTITPPLFQAKGWITGLCRIGASPSAFDIAQAVWLGKPESYNIPDTMGKALISAGSAGDPWSTTLPGTYTGNQAGAMMNKVNNNSGLIPALL